MGSNPEYLLKYFLLYPFVSKSSICTVLQTIVPQRHHRRHNTNYNQTWPTPSTPLHSFHLCNSENFGTFHVSFGITKLNVHWAPKMRSCYPSYPRHHRRRNTTYIQTWATTSTTLHTFHLCNSENFGTFHVPFCIEKLNVHCALCSKSEVMLTIVPQQHHQRQKSTEEDSLNFIPSHSPSMKIFAGW